MARPVRQAFGVSLGRWLRGWFLAVALALALVPFGALPASARAGGPPAWAVNRAQVEVEDDEEEGEEGEEGEGEEEEEEGEEEEEEEEEETDLEVWESPTYGFTLEFDPDVWEVDSEDSSDSGDLVAFFNGPSYVFLSASDAYDGDIEECFAAWESILENSGSIEDFAPLEDEDGEPIADEGDDFVRGAYAFTSQDGEEAVDLECRVLIEDQATLVILLETFADRFAEQVEAKDELLEGLDVSNLEGAEDEEDQDEDEEIEDDDEDDVDRDQDEDDEEEEADDRDAEADDADDDEDADEDATEEDADAAGEGEVVREDFENEAEGLIRASESEIVRYAYDDGEFVVEWLPETSSGAAQISFFPTDAGEAGDVVYAIDVHLVGETAGRAVTVGCREGAGPNGASAAYRLILEPDPQRVALVRVEAAEEIVLAQDSGVEAVEPGDGVNRVELSCLGETIEAAVNGEVVATVEDDAYDAGSISLGLQIADEEPGSAEARWDNLEVRVLD